MRIFRRKPRSPRAMAPAIKLPIAPIGKNESQRAKT